MSAGVSSSDGWGISTFDDQVGASSRVAAVAIRRGPSEEWKKSKGIPVLSLLFHIIGWKLRRWFPRKRTMPVFEPMPPGFNSSTGQGADRICYSSSARVVRIGESEDYKLSTDDTALVLLIDDRDGKHEVSSHFIERPPAITRPQFRPGMDKQEFAKTMGDSHRRLMADLMTRLNAEPTIRHFIEAGTGRGSSHRE